VHKATETFYQEGEECQSSFSKVGVTAWMATQESWLCTALHLPTTQTHLSPFHSRLLSPQGCLIPEAQRGSISAPFQMKVGLAGFTQQFVHELLSLLC